MHLMKVWKDAKQARLSASAMMKVWKDHTCRSGTSVDICHIRNTLFDKICTLCCNVMKLTNKTIFYNCTYTRDSHFQQKTNEVKYYYLLFNLEHNFDGEKIYTANKTA